MSSGEKWFGKQRMTEKRLSCNRAYDVIQASSQLWLPRVWQNSAEKTVAVRETNNIDSNVKKCLLSFDTKFVFYFWTHAMLGGDLCPKVGKIPRFFVTKKMWTHFAAPKFNQKHDCIRFIFLTVCLEYS